VAGLRKKGKRKLMPHWTLHNLRRTARSLMSRAGVPTDIAERVLGHKIAGVRGVYDRHAYFDEKHDALKRLTVLIERILNPAPANILHSLRRHVDCLAPGLVAAWVSHAEKHRQTLAERTTGSTFRDMDESEALFPTPTNRDFEADLRLLK
jgi:hypothetical protein